ncbi:MAG: PIN domain-containing protein [Candidatus Hydrogenedentes bacterium]|nr:PIN domain-containing protein [Candidatus Hydrogenedentota bacterium]
MKCLIDINVMIDFLMDRQPHFHTSARVIDFVLAKKAAGALPSHGITTISYYLARGSSADRLPEIIQWLLDNFEIVSCDKLLFESALALKMADYEDAVVVASARRSNCDYIITRNSKDFRHSAVPAVHPAEFSTMVK